MARQFLATLSLPTLPDHPTDGHAGSLYFNTTMNALMMHTGTTWMPVNGSQYNLENHIHTYDGDVHTIIAGAYTPPLVVIDGQESGAQYSVPDYENLDGGNANGN
jgi:hypothetical protein